MKRLFTLALVALMIVAMAVPASALDKNGSIGVVPGVATAPTVDGKIDSIYNSGLKFSMPLEMTDFSGFDTEATNTVYMVHNNGIIYVCIEVEYVDPLELYNEYLDAWNQECVEIFLDYYNNADTGDVKVGRHNTVNIQSLVQYRVDLDGHCTGETVFNSTTNTTMANPSEYFSGAAVKSDDFMKCTFEFGIKSLVPLNAGTHLGVNIVIQDKINSGSNYAFYRHTNNWVAGQYPYLEIGAGSTGGGNVNVSGGNGTDNNGNVVNNSSADTAGSTNSQTATNTSDVTLIASASMLAMAAAAVVIAKSRKR